MSWSGTVFYIAKALKEQSFSLHYIRDLKERYSLLFKGKKFLYRHLLKKQYSLSCEPAVLEGYKRQVSKALSKHNTDIVFSPGSIPIAYLDCNQPIVFWTDATFAGMINFYPGYKNLCDETIRGGNAYEQSALQRCKLALYASEWAAKTAITNYQVDAAKVKVIPFGANIDCDRTEDDIKTIIKAKTTDKCKLLFIGIDWKRKGGDVAVKVAEELNRSGLKTELIVLGCEPKTEEPLPEFVRTCGFIDKSTSQGRKQFNNLMEESHFLILPTKAECYGLVLCEANSFGVPCLTTDVGGVPTIIKQGLNGKCFDVQADIGLYCRYVCDLFTDYSQYINLSLSAFNEYKTRLNWQVAGKTVKKLVSDIV